MRTYLIGGGASITPEIIDFLKSEQKKGHKLFGCNHAFEFLDLDYLIYLDQHLYTENRTALDNFKGKVFTRCVQHPKGSTIIKCVKEFKYLDSIENGVFCGYKGELSGIGAVSIALNLGLEPLYLVGYDGGAYQGKVHIKHPKQKAETYMKKNEDYEAFKGKDITNLNEESHIKTFKRDNYKKISPTNEKSILFHSYYGFGDQIHMRPFVMEALKTCENVYVVTPYPDILYHNTKVKCLAPKTELKNQKEWTAVNKDLYSEPLEKYDKVIRFDYGTSIRTQKRAILHTLNEQFPICKQSDLCKIDMSFPIKQEWVKRALEKVGDTQGKKLCLVKLPTLRKEWQNGSRNALMKYFQLAIDKMKDKFYFVSVADLREGKEWLTEECPKGIDKIFHNAEMTIDEIVGLSSVADFILTTPSYMTALSAVNNFKAFNIFGGSAPDYIYRQPLNPPNYGFIEPTPFCFCFTNEHICNKEIDEKLFTDTLFEHIEKTNPDISMYSEKRTLLICRMGAELASKIQKSVKDKFNVITLCHTDINEYKKFKFDESYQFRNSRIDDCEKIADEIIKRHNVSFAIIGQKGNGQSDACERMAIQNKVKVLHGERFFDNRIILDTLGLQYTPVNDLKNAETHYKNNIISPKTNREPQPDFLDNNEVYSKYNVKRENTVVLFAQLPYDEAIKFSASPFIPTYDEFMKCLIERNKNTQFLIKYHPQENVLKQHIRYEKLYPNVKECNENIETLFNAFDYFGAFSSTVIFQGLLKGKKFVTCGYHLCKDKRLVHELNRPEWATNIISKLNNLVINQEYLKQHLSFITTKYTVDITKKEVLHKILFGVKFYL